ncbi:unnamed protein product, partial [Meganyctiphanes norvegica]
MINLARTAVRGLTTRMFTTGTSMQAPTVAVTLYKQDKYDGTACHGYGHSYVGLRNGAQNDSCYCTSCRWGNNRAHAVTGSKGAPSEESRNVMVESARISRGNVKSLSELSSASADAVIFPGGFGAAKNLSDFATKGAEMSVIDDVERVIKDFHGAKKPIGLCCIAPMLAAKVLGGNGVTLTLGKPDDGSGKWPYGGSLEAAKALGANVVEKGVDEIEVDEANLVVTAPAFMYEGKFHEIHDNVANMVNSVLKLVK